MRIKTEFLVTGFDWKDKRSVIYTDVKCRDGTVTYRAVNGFKPYFYVSSSCIIPEDNRIVKVERGFKSIYGNNLTKIYLRLPTDMWEVRELFPRCFEGDVRFDWRWRIDNGWVEKNNNVFFLDIEVAMGERFVRDDYGFPITCMTIYDTYSKEYQVFAWRSDLNATQEYMNYKKRVGDGEERVNVRKFNNEKSMLTAFLNIFSKINPDVLTAWNSNFDYVYIINRLRMFDLNPGKMSPLGFAGVDKYSGDARVKGRYVFDLLAAYRKLNIGQLESFKLGDVGEFEFGVDKVKLDLGFKDLWKQNLNDLIIYNIADVELCVELDKKKGIMDFYEGISNFTGAPLDITLQNSRTLDFYFLRHAKDEGIVLPSVDRSLRGKEFEGAIVNDPVKGLHEGVVGLDLRSVSGDTVIYVMCGLSVMAFRIDEFFDYIYSSKENMLRMSNGWYKVSTCDDDGNIFWGEINNVIKHDNDKIMKKIITESGRSIKLTGDHSVFKCECGKMSCVSADDLCVGDIVYVIRDIKFIDKINIDKIDFIVECGIDEFVYDLSVEGTERFFAGNGNILVHNSLYPSIILSGNMSIETISDDGDIKFGNGVSFDSTKGGFITKHVQAFLDRRKEIKKKMLDELDKNGKTQLYHKLNKEQTVTKFITNCFSPDTDVLTPDGIRNIKDFKVGDDVYSVNPDTLEQEIKKVINVYEYDYDDDMIYFESGDVDFIVTPNHRMFVSLGGPDRYGFINADEIFNSGNMCCFLDRNNDDIYFCLDAGHKYFKRNYCGKVYCIEVEDNHTLYAGRNGKFQYCGNSIYGCLSFSSSRYYRHEIGETITYVGREINLYTQKVCEDDGASVLYGDTDSVYVKYDGINDISILSKKMHELQNKINRSYDEFAGRFNIKKHYFDIKAESILERALFVKKKRYAGKVCFDEGVVLEGDRKYIKIMGFQNRRSDTPKFTKGFQKEVLNMILDGKCKDELFSYIRNAVDNFEKLEMDDIAIPKNFTKPFDEYEGGSANSVFINSAKWCNERFDMDIGGGSKVMFLYLKRPSIPGGIVYNRGEFYKVNNDDIVIDYDRMKERGIYMPIKTIIEAMGWTEDELKTGELQAKLSDFF